jgi:hypothetical protein
VPKFKLITTSVLSDRLKVRASGCCAQGPAALPMKRRSREAPPAKKL